MKKNWSKIVLIVVLVLMIAVIGYLVYGYAKKTNEKKQNPIVTMEIQDYGTVKMELYPDMAPNTVTNFITLANRGFYDGKTFHRTIPDFMIQGGSKDGNGQGDPTLSDIKDGGSET